MKKIKIAAWSIGEHAQRNILPVFPHSATLELHGIYTRNIQVLRDQSTQSGCIPYASSSEMLNDDDLDAIYISSPNALHYQQVLEALKYGKHVIVEKRALTNFKETKEVLDLAEEKGLFVMEAFMYLFHNQFKYLKRLIESQKYGKITFMEVNFGFPHLDNNNIRYSKLLSGGALNDAGAYTVSAVQNLLGLDSELEYSLMDTEDGYEVDTSGLAILKNKNSKAICKWVFGSSYRNDIVIWNEKGHIYIERAFSKPPNYEAKILVTSNGHIVEEIRTGQDNHFLHMFDYFAQMVVTNSFAKEHEKMLSLAFVLDKIRAFQN